MHYITCTCRSLGRKNIRGKTGKLDLGNGTINILFKFAHQVQSLRPFLDRSINLSLSRSRELNYKPRKENERWGREGRDIKKRASDKVFLAMVRSFQNEFSIYPLHPNRNQDTFIQEPRFPPSN